ncbi:MAG: hypothetical protein JWQ25_2835 [Daejeonella sp.]|nr:hypothetical protein [Daejeonella sp.]
MIKAILILFLAVTVHIPIAFAQVKNEIEGQQPNAGIDSKGIIRMVYGTGEKIFCITSVDEGRSFSKPVLVGIVAKMHLGNTRGPQIASSKKYSIITAIDKEGNIHSFMLNHSSTVWTALKKVNDVKDSAPEGLMALTADGNDNFYAVWLDLREKHNNNIYFSSLAPAKPTWAVNKLVYKSPDEHVCECCKPNVYVHENKLVISFRNWLMGSRDIYYTVSTDYGKSFGKPIKSGSGTWKLNGCPMDGGGLVINNTGSIATAWQRNGEIYYWIEGQNEVNIGSGRGVSMAQANGAIVIAWKEKAAIKIKNLKSNSVKTVGSGDSPRVYQLKNGQTFCAWEDNKRIEFAVL